MPKVWKETIEEHRQAVREATIDTAAALVAEHGLRSVTMSQIAEETGIGRATLYKYFSDVESILHEWHERQINEHLGQLAAIRDRADASERLGAVLKSSESWNSAIRLSWQWPRIFIQPMLRSFGREERSDLPVRDEQQVPRRVSARFLRGSQPRRAA